MYRTLALLVITTVCVFGRPYFRDRIPNGYNVPNPCHVPATWNAVGHYNPDHYTQIKNPFALDFRANNFVWNTTICQKDSDGDGMTNGEELGDSNCSWKPGQTPPNAVGHPGICEPVGSHGCNKQHFTCECIGDITKCPNLWGHA